MQQAMFVKLQMFKKILKLCLLAIFVNFASNQEVRLITNKQTIEVATKGVINQSFYNHNQELDCGMPEFFIFPDRAHSSYLIATSAVQIISVKSLWRQIQSSIVCYQQTSTCEAKINNLCNIHSDQHQIDRIQVDTSIGNIEYLVDCSPDQFYKPFEIGLFLLIVFSSFALTLSSIYSKAWSYSGYGYKLNNKVIISFNILLIFAIFLGYLVPQVISVIAQIIGSILGAAGVTVCVSESIWLLRNKQIIKPLYKKIRLIDIISSLIGLSFIPLYWLLNGNWLINDIMAVCSIVAIMKLIKIKSLSQSIFLLFSLLVLQILVGLFVHYVFELSYNNYIINLLQNPLMLVMPSITHQLYRNCAWLPISVIVFPGLLLSYLRRFDKSRGTFLYFLIGLIAFYIGSLLWMVIDIETVHSLPFAIISQPVTILIICVISIKRNEFRMLWRGTFHDQQLHQNAQVFIKKETEIINPTLYSDLTDNLRISEDVKSEGSYQITVISEGNQ